jgi:hypothetical protein
MVIKKNNLSDTLQGLAINRRQFLKQTGIASFVASMPIAMTREAFALPLKLSGVDLHKRTTNNPGWMAEARVYGMAVSGLKVDQFTLNRDIDLAIEQGANVIEADSRLSDYLTDQDFDVELQLITDATKIYHQRGLKVVWYIPALEIITPDGRFRKDTFGQLHPDWLQLSFDRKRWGVFLGDKVFWIKPNDESAWMCPNSPYRDWYINRLQKLAKTGIDAIWIDVPLFGLVLATWGCACHYCRDKFFKQTGMQFPDTFDVTNKRFWRYVRWRHETLKEFMDVCRETILASNPHVITIAEVVGLDHLGATEWGTEGSSLSNHFIVWEQDGNSETTAMADASYDDWIAQFSSYKYCRGATLDKPSWAFTYGFNEPDAQLVMAAAIAAQNNPYELRVPKMTTTVGMEFRGMMYNWIAKHSKQVFLSQSLSRVAIIYSARNRDFLDAMYNGGMVISQTSHRDRRWLGSRERSPVNHEYMGDYRGLSLLLYQHQIPTDIFPISRIDNTLLNQYPVLVLPYMAILDEAEQEMLLAAVRNGATLIVSGPEPGYWKPDGSRRKNSLWARYLDDADKALPVSRSVGNGQIRFWQREVGRDYLRTHSAEISRPILSWLKQASVAPWVSKKNRFVVQPYIYENEIIIHVLNYSWVGALENKPVKGSLELVIPGRYGKTVKHVLQSEPQWDKLKPLTFSRKDKQLVIPMECGINALVRIGFA